MLAAVDSTPNVWAFLATAATVLGGIVVLIVQQRGARNAATTAATVAAETKTSVESTKVTAEKTQSIISNVAANLDASTMAGLLADATHLLTAATAALARCEDENRQLVALVHTLERKVDIHDRELAGYRAAFEGMGREQAPQKRPAPRARKQS